MPRLNWLARLRLFAYEQAVDVRLPCDGRESSVREDPEGLVHGLVGGEDSR